MVWPRPRSARLEVIDLPGHAPIEALLAALDAQPHPAVLDSAAGGRPWGRHTVLACRPVARVRLADGRLTGPAGAVLADDADGLWAALGRLSRGVALAGPAPRAGYAPGWIGYLGYELGRWVERLPGRAVRDTPLPDLHLAFYDAILLGDALTGGWQLRRLVFDDPPAGAGLAAEALGELYRRAAAAGPPGGSSTAAEAPCSGTHSPASPVLASRAESNFTPAAYRQAVARAVEYIAAGDIFQVNLSQRLTVPDAPPPLATYLALRRRNPAAYAGYLPIDTPAGRCTLVSSSPELFLRVAGREVLTRPIKGTRPRGRDEGHDAHLAGQLLASAKDNAELAMIIDLLRNDLGRVCEYGSVRVTEPRCLETHPTVHHLVGTVTGRLREGLGVFDLLRASFPGGSITGAPKIRAMEIIDEIEPVARGPYTGCLGLADVAGRSEWNILIRTIVHDRGRALVQAGGGIVADSDPAAEHQETLDKARALLEAIAAARR